MSSQERHLRFSLIRDLSGSENLNEDGNLGLGGNKNPLLALNFIAYNTEL